MEQYARYHQQRMSKEAEDEALADDHTLKAIEAKVKKRGKPWNWNSIQPLSYNDQLKANAVQPH